MNAQKLIFKINNFRDESWAIIYGNVDKEKYKDNW